MFEWKAREQGRADGQADAMLNRPRRPRPDLFRALISNQYRDTYLIEYKCQYDYQRREEEAAQARDLIEKSHLIAGESVPDDRIFERGWRDGFDGKDTPPKGLSHDQIKTFERGHRIGRQQREYKMAEELRQRSQNQHLSGPQAIRGR